MGYTLSLNFQPAIPYIENIVPSSGHPGDIVTIEGSGFSILPARNIVMFNSVMTDVVSAEPDSLQVIVPDKGGFFVDLDKFRPAFYEVLDCILV